MVTVLVTKPGALNDKDKDALRKDDIVVVETEEPETVRWLKPSEIFDPADMMRAALYSIANSNAATKERFVGQLAIIGKANQSA